MAERESTPRQTDWLSPTFNPDMGGATQVPNDPGTKTFESGAQREALEHAFRFDLISPFALDRLAQTYAEGAMKYDDHNWRKGMPFSSLLNHLLYHINLYSQGDRSEDHLAHAAWGLFAMMEFEVTDPAQNDLYFNDDGDEDKGAEAPDPPYRQDYSGRPEDCTCCPRGTQLTQEILDSSPVWSEFR